MLKKLTLHDKIYILEVLLFALIVTGVLPRGVVPFFALAIAVYVFLAPVEEGTLFFIKSIPLFIAIPITATFDSFNTWRIASIIIAAKWFLQFNMLSSVTQGAREFIKKPFAYLKAHRLLAILGGLLLLAVLSLFKTTSITTSVTRIIYFVNLSLVGIVLFDLLNRNDWEFGRRVIKAVALPTMLVIAVGYIQVLSTYLIDIYQFMRIWGEGIQLNQFGTLWSNIAVRVGNTWFAYYGEQLSLRVFSLFPDSHTFPIFLLLGLPALFAIGIRNIAGDSLLLESLKRMYRTRAKMSIVWVPALFLIAILSGTRGIWAASVGVLPLACILTWWFKRTRLQHARKNLFVYLSTYFISFFMLFAIAYPIFVSPQFLLSKGDWDLLRNRIKSIIDFGETSNSQRLEIWEKSVQSIGREPGLGVGIGNFPVVLDQHVFLARAGSTAHNVYLHIAAEMGIPALLLALWFMWKVFAGAYRQFREAQDPFHATYFAVALLAIPWVYAYLLTDAALFDERTFLMFTATAALALKERTS